MQSFMYDIALTISTVIDFKIDKIHLLLNVSQEITRTNGVVHAGFPLSHSGNP